MKTPLEQLIEYIEEFTLKTKITDGIWSKAKSLLETEKIVIINAFNQGYREGETEMMVADTKKDVSEYDDAINYFNHNFNKKIKP
jgi:hypothetical protein